MRAFVPDGGSVAAVVLLSMSRGLAARCVGPASSADSTQHVESKTGNSMPGTLWSGLVVEIASFCSEV
eukprot:3122402-Rhodomonas_salina.2